MRIVDRRLLAVLIILGPAVRSNLTAQAQRSADSGSFRGRVNGGDDTSAVAGAEIWFPALGRSVVTGADGVFQLSGLASGPQLLRIRRVGFVERNDTVTLGAGREVVRNYVLTRQVPNLDTVKVRSGQVKYLSPSLRAFETRRLSGNGGHFVSDSTFRANENSTLASVIQSRMPGMMMAYFFEHRLPVSSRKACQGPAMQHKCGGTPNCFVAIYVDGQLFFNTRLANELQPSAYPDLDASFPVSVIAGAEFYSSAGGAPVGMHVDDDGCGSLWIWTREK